MISSPLTVIVSGDSNAGKSTLTNACLSDLISPPGVLETTAKALHISSGVSDGMSSDTIKVHRSDGRVDVEPKCLLVEQYTGREARNEDVEWIDIQTIASASFSSGIRFIDTPGIRASGDFGKRHEEILAAEIPKADVRIHLLTNGGSELRRLKTRPHQPLVVVQSRSDTKLDMSSRSPFDALEAEKLRFKETSLSMDIEIHYCAPLIALGAELLSDAELEQILALGDCSAEVFERLISPRACLESEIPDTPLTLSERQFFLSKMSETLFSPGGSRYGAWPVWRCGVFFSRHYQIRDVKSLRETLLHFSGIPELRRAISSYVRPVRVRRTQRVLIEALEVLNASALSELSCLREKISALEVAIAHAQGAVCEITAAARPVLGVLKSEESTRSGRLLRYENALTCLESSPLDGDSGEGWTALKWLLENDCGLPFALRQQALEVLRIAEKKGDAN